MKNSSWFHPWNCYTNWIEGTCEMESKTYKPKENVTKEEKVQLNFNRHEVIPLWKYTDFPDT
jgi:hypothetical protein